MRIAVIGAKGLPARQGGIEHHCQEIYSRMVKQGHSVDLFARASYTHPVTSSPVYVSGVRVIALPGLRLRGVDAFISSAIGAIASSQRQYDIIHFHALGPAIFSWLPKTISSAKIVVTCHGLDWARAKWGKLSRYLLRQGETNAVQFADEIIVVSEELHTYFQQNHGRKTVYIPNAAASYAESDPYFSYGASLNLEEGRYILFLGRLVPEKRPELLVKAFQALKPSGWKLVIIGGSSDTQEFFSEVTSLAGGSPDIIFTGELWGSQLAEIVRGAGLFVLPSEIEGLPIAMLEAMREGIPVLASDIPINQQLISEKRGLVFTSGNLNSCIRSLEWAISHPQEMAVMAYRAQMYVQMNFNWDRITNKTLKVYNRLLSSVSNSTPVSEGKVSLPGS